MALSCNLSSIVPWCMQVQDLHPAAAQAVLLDLPGLLFFSTYTLLVLFWAEIYHQARNIPTASLRPAFMAFNAAVYAVQVRQCPWLQYICACLCLLADAYAQFCVHASTCELKARGFMGY